MQSAFWGMVGDRFSLSDLVLLSLSGRRSVAVLSKASTVHCSGSRGHLAPEGISRRFLDLSVLLLSVVCAGGFLYHGGEFVSFST